MHKFSIRRLIAALAVCCVAVPGVEAAVQNRIAAVESAQSVALAQSVSPRISGSATDLGEADGTKALSTITMRFAMTAAQKTALIQLLEDQQNPASAKYHQWLTPEQFASQFGMSSSDLATVSQWLTGQGFTVTGVARSGTFIQFSGTVALAQAAFKTSIHRVSVDGAEHIANVTAVSLPAGIAGVVGSMAGLDDFKLKPHSRVQKVQANVEPNFTSNTSKSNFVSPADFYTIYNVNSLLNNSINGSGVTIAIAGQTDISLSDVAAFRSAAGISANAPTVKLYGADPGTLSADLDEAQLDVEWSGAVAPSASILYVNSKDVINSLTQIIDNNLAPIASISYGLCESGWGTSSLDSMNTIFMQANAQGITVVSASGDSGATDCDYQQTSATQGLAVDFPASSPHVTGLGGTMFSEGTGTYWQTASGSDVLSSALSYIPENVWNESVADIAAGHYLGAGGGGVSSNFTKPYWQTGTGVPTDYSRDVPDVSLNAAANHDGYLYCSGGACVNGFRTSVTTDCTPVGCLGVVGGTSVAAPAFAGLLALVEQKLGSSVGNANPVLYALANSAYYNTVFHDVTVGNNSSPCTIGSTDCPSGGSIGYSANTGYDLATGWGSLDAYSLVNDWSLVTPVSSGATGTQVSTTTATTTSTAVTAGGTVTVTATVVNGGAANSTAPTGTVQFLVDNAASEGAVTLTNGTATFTLSTTALSSGSHSVSAAYSGDAVYAGSKGSVTIDVTSATAADFTLTPATATVTVKSGADATGLVYTVTPVNGFTGSVAFTASTTSSLLTAGYSFSVSPVTISSTTAGTTTLTLSAYVANASTVTGRLRLRPVGSASLVPPTAVHRGWYAGSGAALACVMLLVMPKRRRWSGLLAAVVALGAVSAITGCGTSSSATSATSSTTNTTTGTYTVNVTATGTSSAGATVAHTATVTFVVQ